MMNRKTIRYALLTIVMVLQVPEIANAQRGYKLTFRSATMVEGKYYLGQHFRDKYIVVDSASEKNKSVQFAGSKPLTRGVYTLLDAKQRKLFDVVVDDSQQFSIEYDSTFTASKMIVRGSKSNELMYQYLARLSEARQQSRKLNEQARSNDPQAKREAEKALQTLNEEMRQWEDNYLEQNKKRLFTQLVDMFGNVSVPSTLPPDSRDTSLKRWQAWYYRMHYWDKVDLTDRSLIYTPQLFDKMNYYFFGLLYYQDADTITYYAHRVLDRVEKDSAMLRYFLDFITPKYERNTTNIGWDQVFVNIVKDYYLAGKCSWASEGDLYSKRLTVDFLSQSLIGAMGQELLMADTNQSGDSRDWISSHALPQKYVILWFWDPDCNHCKRQTAELQTLYDSLSRAERKIFEVYAVGYENDTEKWKRYVREHRLPFINVGGPNVNVDYQEAYNVHGAPTMIILNADRRIIMNKTLSTQQIIPFIEHYEETHTEERDRSLSQWQKEGFRRMYRKQ